MYDLIFIGISVLIILLCAGIAAIFSLPKAIARVIVTALCALSALVVCWTARLLIPSPEAVLSLLQACLEPVSSLIGIDLVPIGEQVLQFANISTTLIEFVAQLIVALILPLCAVLLFALFYLIAWGASLIVFLVIRIVRMIKSKVKKKQHEKAAEQADGAWEETPDQDKPKRNIWLSVGFRVISAGLGAVQGMIIVGLLLIPLSGYLSVADPVVSKLSEHDILPGNNSAVTTAQQIVHDANNSLTLKVYRTLGGRAITDSIMSMKVAGTKVKLSEELDSMITLSQHVIELSKTEFKNYSEEEAEIIRAIGDSFADSKLLSPIFGDVLYAATEAWLNGETFIGIPRPSLGESGEMFEPTITTLLEILNEDAKENLRLQADVETTADLVAVLAQNGVFAKLSNTDELLETMGGDVISELVTTLGNNESMKRLIPEIMNIGVRAIGQVLNVPADAAQVYDTFMNDVADTLNNVRDLPEQERVSKLSSELETAFDTAGIEIDTQVLDFYSTAILHDLVDNNPGQEITSADVQAFFVLYAEGARNTGSSMSTKPGFDLLSDTDSKATDPFVGTVYESMTEAQRQRSAAVAVGSLCFKLSELDQNDKDITQRATALVTDTFSDMLSDSPTALEIVTGVQITAPVSAMTTEGASSLRSTEEMKKTSKVITLETLLVDAKEIAQSITPETIGLDANAISAIFDTAVSLKDVLSGGDIDISKLASSVGTILDSLAETNTFGKDKTASLFTSVLQSETVRDKANLDMKTATELAEKATEGDKINYTETMTTVAGAANIMEKLSADGTVSEDELVDLIRNLNAQTAGMIEIYVTPTRLVENNIPEKHSVISSDLIKSLFGYIADSDKSNSEIEAKAVNQILNIALAAKDSDDKKLFSTAPGAGDGKLPTATETVNTLLDSKAVRHALVDVLTDGKQVTTSDPYEFGSKIAEGSKDRADLVAAIEAYGAANPDVDQLTLNALAALFGVNLND